MAITFNDQYKNIYNAYFYDDSAGTYTARGSAGRNIDFFNDNSVVGDAILFAVDRVYNGKYNEIKFNIATPLVADSISVVWEYARRGSSYSDINWQPLSGVVDNTNAFQNSGANSVTFSCPEDWENYLNPGGKCKWYAWYIRCRITSVTNLTEGGKQSSDTIQIKPVAIWVSDFTENSPCTLQDIYDADQSNGWGVVTKNGNVYTFNCGLITDQSTGYFQTKQEVIQFLKNWDCWFYGKIVSGEVVSGDKCRHGSEFIFNLYNGDLYGKLAYYNAEIYNTHYRYINLPGSSTYHGHWGGELGSRLGQKIYDIYGEGLRQFYFSNNNNVIIGAKGYGFYVETPGAILKNITCYGGSYSVRPNIYNTGDYMHECDFSGALTAPINPYLYTGNNNNFLMYFVDCNWGVFEESHYVRWRYPGTNNVIYVVNSFLLKVIDANNNSISGAKVILKDKNGTEIFNYTTSENGYIGQDSGTVSSATTDTLTDNSKNWNSDQWWFREVYITSGTGIGQRRIIKKGNTATELQVAPDWDVVPDSTSKYIIIPYVNVIKIEPETPEYTGYCYSVGTSYNPFTITITKAGYQIYKKTFTLNKKVDWVIALKHSLVNADQEVLL